MKRYTIITILLALLLTSCEKAFMDEDTGATKEEVFEYLWTRIDQNYSLFDVKNVDWDSIHTVYQGRLRTVRNDAALFDLLSSMLNTLEDGHVNLYSDFDVSHDSRSFNGRYGRCNIDINVVAMNYLTSDYHVRSGFSYNTVRDGRVLYVRYSSFSNSASSDDLQAILDDNKRCQGLILDMRQNGGGSIENIWNLLRLLPSENQVLYKTQIKSGPAHDAFSELEICKAPSNDSYSPYTKPVMVLTDRGSFSATSFFALSCKSYNNVKLVGDTTGGGLGLPSGGQLPNGWYYRHSITRTLSPDGVNYENGVPPDHVVMIDTASTAAGKDNVIEKACDLILGL